MLRTCSWRRTASSFRGTVRCNSQAPAPSRVLPLPSAPAAVSAQSPQPANELAKKITSAFPAPGEDLDKLENIKRLGGDGGGIGDWLIGAFKNPAFASKPPPTRSRSLSPSSDWPGSRSVLLVVKTPFEGETAAQRSPRH